MQRRVYGLEVANQHNNDHMQGTHRNAYAMLGRRAGRKCTEHYNLLCISLLLHVVLFFLSFCQIGAFLHSK